MQNVWNNSFCPIKTKCPEFYRGIINHYFGYVTPVALNIKGHTKRSVLSITYVGYMGLLRKPELLYQIYCRLADKAKFDVYFIGEILTYKPLRKLITKHLFYLFY